VTRQNRSRWGRGAADVLPGRPRLRRRWLVSEAGRKQPTASHEAIADLVKAVWIKVIITTNFDRLIEQALDAVGVTSLISPDLR